MKPKDKGSGFREPGRDQVTHRLGLEREYIHDTYKLKGKLPEPTVCPECGAIFEKGRWSWGTRPPDAHEKSCPACNRIRDEYPAGILHLGGPIFKTHKEEILSLVRRQEAKAKKEHPLSRIISTSEDGTGAVILTTDAHLPRQIGEALRHAYHGTLDFNYGQDSRLVRMKWEG